MKYLCVLLLLISGCSSTEREPCEIYKEVPYIEREYFRYPAEGYIEKTSFRLQCVEFWGHNMLDYIISLLMVILIVMSTIYAALILKIKMSDDLFNKHDD